MASLWRVVAAPKFAGLRSWDCEVCGHETLTHPVFLSNASGGPPLAAGTGCAANLLGYSRPEHVRREFDAVNHRAQEQQAAHERMARNYEAALAQFADPIARTRDAPPELAAARARYWRLGGADALGKFPQWMRAEAQQAREVAEGQARSRTAPSRRDRRILYPVQPAATVPRDRRASRAAEIEQDHHDSSGPLLVGAAAVGGLVLFLTRKKSTTTPIVPAVPTCPPAGSLVTAPPDPKWYVIDHDGKKRWITSWSLFQQCGYDQSKLIKISAADLAACPTGDDLTSPPCPPAAELPCPGKASLIRGNPSGKIYVIDVDGTKRWISNWAAFNACRYVFGRVQDTTDDALVRCPSGPDVTGPPSCPPAPTRPNVCAAPGTLVQGTPSGKIYVMIAGAKSWIHDYAAFQSCKYDMTKLVGLTDDQLAQCPDGPDITGQGTCAPGPMAATAPPPPAPTGPACKTMHTVASHDTLWDLAGTFYGNPALYPRIYAANAALIESTAHAHGYPSSDGGHWIWADEVLCIPA